VAEGGTQYRLDAAGPPTDLLRECYNGDDPVTSGANRIQGMLRGPDGRGMSRQVATVAAVAASVAVLAAALLPWHRSGSVDRNAFSLARAARDIGAVDGTVPRGLLTASFAMPALVAGAWLAATFRRHRLLAMLGGTVGAIGLAGAIAILASPIRPGSGVWAALAAGTAGIAAALVLVLLPRRPE
jgi:hypothetical protein